MEKVARIFDELPSIDDYKRDNPSIEIEQLTKKRLDEFSDNVTPILKETYGKTESLLKDSTSEERPADILKRIENALEKLDKECVGNEEIWNPKKDGIYDSVKNIRDWMDKHVRDFKKHL